MTYSVGLPLSPHSQKFGYESNGRYKLEQRRSLNLIKSQRRFITEASTYELSYTSSSTNPTVLHYRDYLISEAAAAFVVNTQFANEERTQLTEQSNKVWSSFSFDSMWNYLAPDASLAENPAKYWGELGSLGYYSLWVNQSASLPEVIESTLKLVWGLVGTSYSKLPRVRVDSLLTSMQIDKKFLESITAKWSAIFSLTSKDEKYFALQAARRHCLSSDSLSNLTNKILFGQYTPKSFELLTSFLSDDQQTKLSKILSSSLELLKPVGMSLICQALIVEGYLRAAIYLSELDLTIQTLSLSTFQVNKDYSVHTRTIAQYLSLAYDSYNLLNTLSIRESSAQSMEELSQQIVFWLNSSDTSILPTEDYRFDNLL